LTPEEEEQKIEQVAQVLEMRQQDLERFESVAEALIGHDEFFLDEISRARTRGRYIGGPELLIYLKDFLQAHYRTCTLKEEPSAGLYTLRVTPELRQFVRDSVPSSDLGLRLFLQRSSSGEVRLTIDSELAQANQRVEFLTFHHPLI